MEQQENEQKTQETVQEFEQKTQETEQETGRDMDKQTQELEQKTQEEQKPNSTDEDLRQLRAQTRFDEEQFLFYHDMFMRITSGNKGANVADFVEQFTAMSSEASPFAVQTFQLCDKNGDKTVSLNEYILAMDVEVNGTADEKAEWAFKLYDADETGAISKEDMREIIRAMSFSDKSKKGRLDKYTEVFFGGVDYDKDGQITFEEFKRVLKLCPAILEGLMNPDSLI